MLGDLLTTPLFSSYLTENGWVYLIGYFSPVFLAVFPFSFKF